MGLGRTFRRRQKVKPIEQYCVIDHQEKLINLMKFMKSNGYGKEFNHLKVCNFKETGRGVITTKTIHENDVLIRVPYNLMITFTTLLQSLDFIELFTPGSKLTIHELLTLYLVLESHKKESLWKFYIDSLPEIPPWVPSLLSLQQIELLPPDLRLATQKSRRLLEESWSRLRKSINPNWICRCCCRKMDCVLDLKRFMWGYIMVNTRAVYVNPKVVREVSANQDTILSDEPSMALCPFLDMFNHSPKAKTDAELIYGEDKPEFQLTTKNVYRKYDQVFICYGSHSNITLITEYGFYISGNHFNSITFESKDILEVLKPKLSSAQIKFIRDKLDCQLYINELGLSFNLKAFLFVICYEEVKDIASVIYSNSYPSDFEQRTNDFYQSLVLDQLKKCDLAITHGNFHPLILSYLNDKVQFIKSLLINKQ